MQTISIWAIEDEISRFKDSFFEWIILSLHDFELNLVSIKGSCGSNS